MKKKKAPELTEEKILAAARKVFLRKGYAASRTRDIAEEAGINLALLNYYFRSKEKLFEIVMTENIKHFAGGIIHIINDSTTGFDRKIELIAMQYIDNLTSMPDLPLFVLSELRNHPDKLVKSIHAEKIFLNSILFSQYNELLKKKKVHKIHPVHLLTNIVSLSVFPFVSAPLIKSVGSVNDREFMELMQQRRQLIPLWIKSMLYIK
jgi:AcrR family transcriptional regulator